MNTARPPEPPPYSTLSTPVGALMRATGRLGPEDSLGRAAQELRRSGNGLVPLVVDDVLVGAVTEASIGRALADGCEPTDSCEAAMVQPATIAPYASAAEALRLTSEGEGPILVVVDDRRRLMGLIGPSDLYPRRPQLPRPAMVGGMATPFGVYLTNGSVTAGAGGLALAATGALLFTMLVTAQLAVLPLTYWLANEGAPGWLVRGVDGVLPIGLFMLLMRLAPLSGTHAAEHQVVHAIERGEELREDVVRRMPRVHPRCGTNLAVAAMLFLGIFGYPWVELQEVRFMVAALATLFLWRPLGSAMQLFVTTKPASERQLRNGVRAGTQLLERYAQSRITQPSIPRRLWCSGMLHVMAGSFLCYGLVLGLVELAERVFGLVIPI